MTSPKLLGRWLIAPALFLAFCSKGNSPSLTGPSSAAAPAVIADSGSLGISAAGDVKVGTGTLEFLNLRIYGFKGDNGAGGFANPGETYGMTPGVEVKLSATYPPGSPANPKFRVDWGDGAVDAGGCGACSATHTYARPGLYTVKASLDDRVSTMVTRTFTLDARPADGRNDAPAVGPHALCADILTTMDVWGQTARGVDLRAWTDSTLHYIGCPGDGCSPADFYCTDNPSAQTLAFGNGGSSTLRAAVDPGNALGNTMPTSYSGCCTGPLGLCNAPNTTNNGFPVDMAKALCNALGYANGTVVRERASNSCPEADVRSADGLVWSSDFVNSSGSGEEYLCTGYK